MKTLILLALCVSVSAIGLGRKQSAGVRGQLVRYYYCNKVMVVFSQVCDGKPASNVKVKLYDDDRGIDTDDLLASGKTDSQGRFELSGYTHEFTTIDPKLNVYHDCNDGLTVSYSLIGALLFILPLSTNDLSFLALST